LDVAPADVVGAGVVVGDAWEDSAGVLAFGTVMNLDPSLFVYLAVLFEVGERGAEFAAPAGGWRWPPFMAVDC